MQQQLNPQKLFSSLDLSRLRNVPRTYYVLGDAKLLTSGHRVSLIGSRIASQEGIRRAKSLAKILVSAGVTIVSGLAEGIDTAAHQAAIEFGGKTIGVIGTPLNRFYPKSNQALQELIAKKHLLLSQFPEGEQVTRSNFPARNKTMALISDATVIIEASEASGVLHQARAALHLGRPLYIMESITKDPTLSWPQEFIKQGAIILNRAGVGDLITALHKS